jgi:hypothetical protein
LACLVALAGCSLGDDEKPDPRISPVTAGAVTSAAADTTTLATTTTTVVAAGGHPDTTLVAPTTVPVPVTCGADADEQHPPPCD